MSRNWTNFATVPINSISKPTGVPSLNAPSLWYYNRDGVIYSGLAGTNSLFGNAPLLPPQSIWSFKPDFLTLPAFHWIVVPYVPLQNRHTHSCNAVGGSQVIIIGGTQPTVDHLTSLSQEQSEYNDTDVLAQGLAIFDMTKPQFVDQFTAGQPPYEQSRPIKDFYTRSQGYVLYLHLFCLRKRTKNHSGYQQNLVAGVAALMQINSSLAGKSLPSNSINPTKPLKSLTLPRQSARPPALHPHHLHIQDPRNLRHPLISQPVQLQVVLSESSYQQLS